MLRVRGPEPTPSQGWRRRAESWLGATSPWRRWWEDSAAEVLAELDVDVIHVSMSPYASATAAGRIAAAKGIPWIAELRDPWALDEMIVFPTGVHRRRELARMEDALRSASAIVMNTPEAAERLRESLPSLRSIPIVSIPNGYDAEDFQGAAPETAGDPFRIVHTGYFHTELGRRQHRMALKSHLLGGSVPGVDILSRSHVYLLRAVELALSRLPTATIEIHLAGLLSPTDLAVADRFNFVRLHGYLPHKRSIELLRSADLPRGTRATIVPGKTYEYLAARRPILAAVPEGDARELLESSGTAYVTPPGDVEQMAAAIETEVRRRRENAPAPTPNAELLARFERRALTSELVELFESVLDGAGSRRSRRVAAG